MSSSDDFDIRDSATAVPGDSDIEKALRPGRF